MLRACERALNFIATSGLTRYDRDRANSAIEWLVRPLRDP